MATDPQHIETTKFIELDAKNAPSDHIQWDTAQLQTESIPIIDPGVGEKMIVRSFFFKASPLPKGIPKPTKLEIINSYKRLLESTLWSDGLIPVMNADIKLYTKGEIKKYPQLRKKFIQEKADFVIMLTAEARKGVNILENAQKAT